MNLTINTSLGLYSIRGIKSINKLMKIAKSICTIDADYKSEVLSMEENKYNDPKDEIVPIVHKKTKRKYRDKLKSVSSCKLHLVDEGKSFKYYYHCETGPKVLYENLNAGNSKCKMISLQ